MRIAGSVSVAVALTIALAVAAAPAPAAPQGPWLLPALDLSVIGRNAEFPQIAAGSDGSFTAVWSRNNGSNSIVQAATRPAGGSFGAPVDLSATGQNALNPQITTAPDGTTTAIWSRNNGSNSIIQAATRPPGGSFGLPDDLSDIGQSAYLSQLSSGPDGTTTAVWLRYNGSNDIAQAAIRPPGGGFGAPVNLSTTGQHAESPQVTTAPDGTVTAVWQRSDGIYKIIQAATRPPGGSFGAPVDLSATGQSAIGPRIATAPDGTATVIWYRFDGGNFIVQAATRPPGGSFGLPLDLSATGQDAADPQVTTAPDGTVTAVWRRNDGSDEIIQATTRPPGGSFGLPLDLSATGHNANRPQITTAPDGTTTALWYRNDGANNIAQAATRPPGGGFGLPVDLSAPGQNALTPQIAAASDGSATAVWQRFNGANNIIQGISTAQPSVTLGAAKDGSGSGTITSTPAGIDCGTDCAESYPSYTEVTLTATPDSGSSFTGWGGACGDAAGNTCELTMLDDASATAGFGRPKLKVARVKPKKPKANRGKKVKLKVTARNAGDGAASNSKLCLKLSKKVRKALKPKGRTCQRLGSLAPGKAKTKAFKLKATGKAKRGKKYKAQFKLTARGAKAATRAVKVKVK